MLGHLQDDNQIWIHVLPTHVELQIPIDGYLNSVERVEFWYQNQLLQKNSRLKLYKHSNMKLGVSNEFAHLILTTKK